MARGCQTNNNDTHRRAGSRMRPRTTLMLCFCTILAPFLQASLDDLLMYTADGKAALSILEAFKKTKATFSIIPGDIHGRCIRVYGPGTKPSILLFDNKNELFTLMTPTKELMTCTQLTPEALHAYLLQHPALRGYPLAYASDGHRGLLVGSCFIGAFTLWKLLKMIRSIYRPNGIPWMAHAASATITTGFVILMVMLGKKRQTYKTYADLFQAATL